MPGLVPGIHVFRFQWIEKDVDGRVIGGAEATPFFERLDAGITHYAASVFSTSLIQNEVP